MSTNNWIPLTLQINEDPDFPVMDSIINNIVSANTEGYPALNNENYLNCEVRAYRPLPGETTVNWSENPFMVGSTDKIDTVFTLARVEGNLNIASGAVVTTPVRKLGLGILVTGNLTIAGQINMTAKGANHRGRDLPGGESSGFASNYPGREIRLFNKNSVSVLNRTNPSEVIDTTSNPSLPGRGADGSFFAGSSPDSGQGYAYGATGGGGAGSAWSIDIAGLTRGSDGTTFSGGTGGGGRSSSTGSSSAGTRDGGAGGNANLSHHGGGGGNPVGTTNTGVPSGTAGVIILVVLGNLVFSSGNNLISDGQNGSFSAPGVNPAASGGGSGGGSINLIVSGSSTITGTINASVAGGASGGNDLHPTGSIFALNGASGSIQIYRM